MSVLDVTNIAINGINLYAYCLNNPVNDKDTNGNFGFLLALLIAACIGAGVGAISYTAAVVIDFAINNEWNWSWGDFLGSMIGGAIGGVVSLVPLPWGMGMYLGAFVGGFTSSVFGDILDAGFSGTYFNFYESIGKGLVTGIISTVTTGVLKSMGSSLPKLFGKGSYNQISKQIYTKLFRNAIKKVKFTTLIKMFKLEAFMNLLNPLEVLFNKKG